MINTYTGDLTILKTSIPIDSTTFVPEGHVLIHGTEADMERLASTVSAKYRADRKAKNKAAKKSRRANR